MNFFCVSVHAISCSAERKNHFFLLFFCIEEAKILCMNEYPDNQIILLLSVPLKFLLRFSPNRKISSTAFGR